MKQFLSPEMMENWAARIILWAIIRRPEIVPGSLPYHLVNLSSWYSWNLPLVHVSLTAARIIVPMWNYMTVLRQTLLCWDDFVTTQSWRTCSQVVTRCLWTSVLVPRLTGDLKRNILCLQAEQQQQQHHLWQPQQKQVKNKSKIVNM